MARARRIGIGAVLACAAACSVASPALAATEDTADALDRFLNGLNTLRAAFTQSVTDNRGEVVGAGSGRLWVQRPGRFRWDYEPEQAAGASSAEALRGQLLVADGKNLWFYDRELEQATVKPVEAALSSTPIVLLSGSATQLHDAFEISAGGRHDGLEWVEVKPRSAEADFTHATLGFAMDRLSRMVVNDRLGQTVELDFSHFERNARIDPGEFRFQPPAGADVIGTPQG